MELPIVYVDAVAANDVTEIKVPTGACLVDDAQKELATGNPAGSKQT